MRQWCEELQPWARKIQKSAIKLTQNQKENVLKKFYQPQKNRKSLADSEGISRSALYQWKDTCLGKDFPLRMNSKKEKGINLMHLTNQEKTILIDALRNQFKLKELLRSLRIAKSSYFYQKKALEKPDKYLEERKIIIEIFNHIFNSKILKKFL